MLIRPSTDDDLADITAIYGHHVRHGTGSFELEAPSQAEMVARRAAVLERGLPWLVAADDDGRVLGYAYAGPFRPRPAYRFCVEDSVYLAPQAVGRGVGRILLAELMARCAALGARQMLGVIGDSANHASIRLHESLGFRHTGTMQHVGWKHGRWLDVVFMQRELGLGDREPPVDGA